MSRYEKLFEKLHHLQEGAFIPFVMLGDPDVPTSLQIIDILIKSGADALELGVPFSDPIADGPVIQRAAMRALSNRVKWKDCLRLLQQIRQNHPNLPIGLLLYANLVVHRGMNNFYESVSKAGVDSVLIVDVPTVEAEPFVEAALKHNVVPVLIAPPNASDKQLKQIAKLSKGYTYIVTRPGVTGVEEQLQLSASDLIAKLKQYNAPLPVLGFGIANPGHVKLALSEGAAGAISGSAIVAKIENGLKNLDRMYEDICHFVKKMKEATKG